MENRWRVGMESLGSELLRGDNDENSMDFTYLRNRERREGLDGFLSVLLLEEFRDHITSWEWWGFVVIEEVGYGRVVVSVYQGL